MTSAKLLSGKIVWRGAACAVLAFASPFLSMFPSDSSNEAGIEGGPEILRASAAASTFGGSRGDDVGERVPVVRGGAQEVGVPDISLSPTELSIGPVLFGELGNASVNLQNVGEAPLILGEITLPHLDFTVGGPSGGIPPGTALLPQQSLSVEVTYRARTIGTTMTTLRIPSNDPDESELSVPVSAIVPEPPSVRVSPSSFSESLGFAQTLERELTVFNDGAAELDWAIAFVPGAGVRRGAKFDASFLGDVSLEGVHILWDRSHGQVGTTVYSSLVSDLQARGATVTTSTAPITADLLALYRIYWCLDVTSGWNANERQALASWVRSGGSVALIGDRVESVTAFNALLAELGNGITYSTQSGSADVVTTNIAAHATTENVNGLYLGIQVRTLEVASPGSVLVRDLGGRPVAAALTAGAGRVVTLADEFFDLAAIGQFDNRRFGNQIVDWLSGSGWLSASPATGRAAPGESTRVILTFDSGELAAGSYRQLVRVASNDPVHPELDVPADLEVTGTPDISVPPIFDFGSRPAGGTYAEPILIRNVGLESLTVSSAAVTGAAFAAPANGFVILPESSLNLLVTFMPDSLGPFTGTLSIASDDPVEPFATIALRGRGRIDCESSCLEPYVKVEDFGGTAGIRFGLDVELRGNTAEIRSLGFLLEYDPVFFDFADSVAAGNLLSNFIFVTAQENEIGRITAGAFLDPTEPNGIPMGSSGSIMRVYFRVVCDTCALGTTTDIAIVELLDDLEGMNNCCGRFTFGECLNNGDVNADEILSPADAQCAMNIYLNNQVVPPSCDVSGDCEREAADVDCNGTVTPLDALAIFQRHLEAGEPEACFADLRGVEPEAGSMRFGEIVQEREGIVVPLAGAPLPSAFGIDLGFDAALWRFEGVESGGERVFPFLEAREMEPGRVRIAGFQSDKAGPSGELVRVKLRRALGSSTTVVRETIRMVEIVDARFDGPREIVLAPGSPGSAEVGLRAIGPLPMTGELTIEAYVPEGGARGMLAIYDVSGREVRLLVAGELPEGVRTWTWDGKGSAGRPVAPGVYLVRLEIGGRHWLRKIPLLR